ncbi:hypothetical protein LCGC14_2462050 [marine sediment metagenome]|uniref:Uncharacterized protein n=1 Tax=marine sediment metagenome TaxID=412755 RepID=A0A0F9C0P8_9ZZZZ
MVKTKEAEVYELYLQAREAYNAVSKELMKRTLDEETNSVILSCPHCRVIFGTIPPEVTFFSFREPIFCCGKLMI